MECSSDSSRDCHFMPSQLRKQSRALKMPVVRSASLRDGTISQCLDFPTVVCKTILLQEHVGWSEGWFDSTSGHHFTGCRSQPIGCPNHPRSADKNFSHRRLDFSGKQCILCVLQTKMLKSIIVGNLLFNNLQLSAAMPTAPPFSGAFHRIVQTEQDTRLRIGYVDSDSTPMGCVVIFRF